jgi:hypothetical protein
MIALSMRLFPTEKMNNTGHLVAANEAEEELIAAQRRDDIATYKAMLATAPDPLGALTQ